MTTDTLKQQQRFDNSVISSTWSIPRLNDLHSTKWYQPFFIVYILFYTSKINQECYTCTDDWLVQGKCNEHM